MDSTWILVANRANARLFTNTGSHRELTLLKDFIHSEGRLKDRELSSDKPGRAFDSGGQGRHGMSKSESPSEHETARFAKELATVLEQGRTSHQFGRLILVAEPGFLGVLNGAIDRHTAELVTDTLSKDLAHLDDADIPAVILEHIRL